MKRNISFVSRINLNNVKTIFTSEYWLMVALTGAFFSFFALNRGGGVVFIEAGFFFLLINILLGGYQLDKISLGYWITVAICAYLLIISILFHPQVSHYKWMANLLRMICIIFAIHCLSQKRIESWVSPLFFALLALAVCWQFGVYFFFKQPFGTFSNPHYLCSFMMLALPPLVYAFLTTQKWYRFFFALVVLLDAGLFLQIGSRPAIVGLASGVLFFLIFLIKDQRKWLGFLGIFILLISLYFSNYGDLFPKFKQLIINLPKEERIQLWITSWNMLMDNSLVSWIIGNGIGGFRTAYPHYTVPELKHLIFPHLHLLEITYDNGVIGVILVFGGIILLFISAIKYVKQTANKEKQYIVKCMIVVLISWLIHTGITFPFYSKYTQYSLSFILGILLAVVGNPIYQKKESTKLKNIH